MTTMTPLDQQRRRSPEAGRIRIGVKSGRAMKALDTFRFTSPHEAAINQLAARYGGEPKPWSDPMANKGQFEVITPASSIEIMVIPNGLSTGYELWTGGGCARRCDGYVVEVAMKGHDEPVESPCICNTKGVRECDPKTRLNVVLPQINFFGVWRLESKGWNAMEELPGMYDMISNFSEDGKMVRAFLNLEQRTSKSPSGGTKHYVVPTISLAHTPDELMGGIATAPLSIEAEEIPVAELAPVEEEIIEAVVVDEERDALQEGLVRDVAEAHGQEPDLVVACLWQMTGGDNDKIDKFLAKALDGKHLRFTQNNTLAWKAEA